MHPLIGGACNGIRAEILPGRGAICPARPADHAAVRARLQRLARASFGRLHRVVDPDIFVERSIGFGSGGYIAAGVESDLGPGLKTGRESSRERVWKYG